MQIVSCVALSIFYGNYAVLHISDNITFIYQGRGGTVASRHLQSTCFVQLTVQNPKILNLQSVTEKKLEPAFVVCLFFGQIFN